MKKPETKADPKRQPLQQSEKQIEKWILSWLKWKGFQCFKVESQGTYDAKIGRYRLKRGVNRTVGVSDIIGCLPDGRFLAIEVKSLKGRPSKDQTKFIEEANKNGGLAFIARSIEDVEAVLTQQGVL